MARDTVMKRPKDTRGTLRRMLRYLGPWRYVIAVVLVLSLASNLLRSEEHTSELESRI